MKRKTSENIRLFIEGREIDLIEGESLKNGITIGLASVQDISKKGSSVSKTITVGGSPNNNQLLRFFFDVKSIGNSNYSVPGGFTAVLTNNISGLSVTGLNVYPLPPSIDSTPFTPDTNLGLTWGFPMPFGASQGSFHNSIPNTGFSLTTNGVGTGFIICKVNGTVISCNKVVSGVTNYDFPKANYLYGDVIEIIFQSIALQFSGNIGYVFDPKKKARAYVLSNNQIILSGYAKLIQASSKNGDISYQIQITSELGGLIGALGNSRLEDLFTRTVPDLVNDPTQRLGLTKTIDLPSPYDHQLTLGNIFSSFFGSTPYVWPLIDYGGNGNGSDRSDLTSNSTNFYTSVLRPCIYASDYFDLIMNSVGYSYSSTMLSSSYWRSLIIPYKDGNFANVDTNESNVTSVGSQTLIMPSVLASTPPATTNFYPFNSIVSDPNKIYNTASQSYNPPYLGMYNVTTNLTCKFVCNGSGTSPLSNPTTNIYMEYRVFASGSSSPYASGSNFVQLNEGQVTFGGASSFISNGANITSDPVNISFSNFPIYLNTGDFLKVNVNPFTGGANSSTVTGFRRVSDGAVITGTMTCVIDNTDVPAILDIKLAPTMDGQWIRFKDFVPKSISCKDYLDSIIKLFNLYPVQDPKQKNHFYFYTRDEFFNSGLKHDWSNKIDNSSDISIKPIPELDSAHLLFSYKHDKDYFNKLYDSLYGNFSYGSLRISTGYQFANNEKDVMKGLLFAPTPIVQLSNTEYQSEGPIEINNGVDFAGYSSDIGSSIIMASGYYAANGTRSPYMNQLSDPISNNFSGIKFTRARVGVQIRYQNEIYSITKVYNDYAFQVDRILYRPAWPDPISSTQHRVNNNFYATNDGFTYITDNNLSIPMIYESSDNNVTHKPTKTELRILYFKSVSAASSCNTYYLQYTPQVNNEGMYSYFNGTSAGTNINTALQLNQYPYCHHLNDPQTPSKDLLFAPPIELFYPLSGSYPSKNLHSSYWVNTTNEILDPNSKFLEASIKLDSTTVSNLSLADTISINGTDFRVNQIKDFRSDDSILTKCELIRKPISQNVISAPMVNAGGDYSIDIACLSTMNLFGSVMVDDSLGQSITSVSWSQTSGPSTTITNPGSLSTTITGASITGSYVYKLTVTDNFGFSGNDSVQINVNPHMGQPPYALITSAPSTITLPTSTVTFSSSVTTYNCAVPSQSVWTQTSGAAVTITSPNSLNTTITGITVAGTYQFTITDIDNTGLGGSTSGSFLVLPPVNFTINNFIGSSNISGLSGAGSLTPAFTPILGNGRFDSNHGVLSGATIVINTTGTIPPGTFHMNYRKNGSLVSSQLASNGATYTFSSISATTGDTIEFDLST